MKLLTSLFLFSAAMIRADDALTPLGQAFQINTHWKVEAGDDLRRAQPDFDDSAWVGEQALARYDGLAWYRMAVRVPDVAGPYGLWIPRVLRSGEFFVNGQKLGAYGSLDKGYLERRDPVDPLMLPANIRGGDLLQLAVRVHKSDIGPGIGGKPAIGSWTAVSAAWKLELLGVYRIAIVSIWMSLFVLGATLIAIVYWQGKTERVEALWVGAILLSYFFGDLEAYGALGALQGFTLLGATALPASLWGAWRFFNGAPSLSWRAQAPYLAFFSALLTIMCLGRMQFIPWIYAITSLAFATLLMLPRNAIDTWRRGRKGEIWVLWFFAGYLMATLGALVFYADVIRRLSTGAQQGMGVTWTLISYPFQIDLRNVGEFVSGGVMVGILVRRLYLLLQEKQTLLAELEAARQIQELLVPAAGTRTPGFVIESAYRPALQVGGDFYFVNPLAGGRLLVVVGDVTGKGLRAAMLVSVVVGILRTAVASSAAAVLTALNAGLAGRTGGGFVTACSVLFEADGTATIANAGHCPVYRDGMEVAMEPNLPLGVVVDAAYEQVEAAPGRFVLLSDGVVEAENARRELFGFDRTREISGKPAKEIAEAARTWGQNDEITVVTVRREEI